MGLPRADGVIGAWSPPGQRIFRFGVPVLLVAIALLIPMPKKR